MGDRQPAVILRHLRQLVAEQEIGDSPDGELVQRFAAEHDEAAFGALRRRHGPMVLGVCRRVLGHEQDAEDAFQATFLLAQKAASIRKGEALAGWLHGVAYHLGVGGLHRPAGPRAWNPYEKLTRFSFPENYIR